MLLSQPMINILRLDMASMHGEGPPPPLLSLRHIYGYSLPIFFFFLQSRKVFRYLGTQVVPYTLCAEL